MREEDHINIRLKATSLTFTCSFVNSGKWKEGRISLGAEGPNSISELSSVDHFSLIRAEYIEEGLKTLLFNKAR